MRDKEDSNEQLWTTKDLAKFLKVSERHVFDLVSRGELPQPIRYVWDDQSDFDCLS